MNQMSQEAEAADPNTGNPRAISPNVRRRQQHPRFAKPQRVAFVQSSWHREVVEECRIAFLAEIEARHITQYRRVRGAGLVRNPAACADIGQDPALHRDRRRGACGRWRHLSPRFVADTVIKALMDVQLRTEVPVFSAVLTPQQFHESAAHLEFFRKHFAIKGVEVAEACANTLLSLERLRGQVAAGIV